MSMKSMNQIAMYCVDQLESGVSVQLVAHQLASLLIDERRTSDVSSLLRTIEAELNQRGLDQVTIVSATELTNDIKSQLATALGAKSPVFSEEIDPSVIGGVKVRYGESELDLTVRTKLSRFKQAVVKGVK